MLIYALFQFDIFSKEKRLQVFTGEIVIYKRQSLGFLSRFQGDLEWTDPLFIASVAQSRSYLAEKIKGI